MITQRTINKQGARSGAVGKGTELQTGRSRVRFPIDILPAALRTWGSTQPLTETGTRNTSWGVKAAGA